MANLISASEQSFILSGLTQVEGAQRPEGRPLRSYRPLQLDNVAPIPTASSSARLTAADGLEMLAVVKLEVVHDAESKVAADMLASGRISVQVDVGSAAASVASQAFFETQRNLISSLLTDCLNKVPIATPENLGITRTRSWNIQLTILISNPTGQADLADHAFLVAYYALAKLRIPKTNRINFEASEAKKGIESIKGSKVNDAEEEFELIDTDVDQGSLLDLGSFSLPLCTTLYIVKGRVFIDFTPAESQVADGKVSLAYAMSRGQPVLLHSKLSANSIITVDQIERCFTVGKEVIQDLHKAVAIQSKAL